MKNLIVAAAANYGIGQLKNFIYSAKAHCRCDIALSTQNLTSETVDWLQANGVLLFEREPDAVPVYVSRYYGYRAILDALPDYDKILLSDIRDVVFQRDIFKMLASDELHVFEEAYTTRLSECGANSIWLSKLYGQDILELYRNKVIICSGTSVGGRTAISVYVDEMLKQIERANPESLNSFGLDQGMHNFLIFSNKLVKALVRHGTNLRQMRNGDLILTLARVNEFRFNHEQQMVSDDGSIPALIHQYDRHALLTSVFDAKYPHPPV